MSVEWIRQSANVILSIGVVAAIVECAADDGYAEESLRLLCSLVAALSVLRMALNWMVEFL